MSSKSALTRAPRAILIYNSAVRGAMVGVMLAGASLHHHRHPGAPAPSYSAPRLVGEGNGGVQQAVGESKNASDGGWGTALAAEAGPAKMPRDASTCILWCSIALGALVRGCPVDHVGFFLHLLVPALYVQKEALVVLCRLPLVVHQADAIAGTAPSPRVYGSLSVFSETGSSTSESVDI